MNKNITNYNNKNQSHGYQELYMSKQSNTLWYRGNTKNNESIGYEECHFIKQTRYNII